MSEIIEAEVQCIDVEHVPDLIQLFANDSVPANEVTNVVSRRDLIHLHRADKSLSNLLLWSRYGRSPMEGVTLS